jgi:hypothetical protein
VSSGGREAIGTPVSVGQARIFWPGNISFDKVLMLAIVVFVVFVVL